VEPGELARYLGYEAVFVIGPGWLVLRAIAPRLRGVAWQLGLGWPIGLVLEILAFAVTAALDLRDLFLAYPALVGGLALAVMARRDRSAPSAESAPMFASAERWALAGLALAAFAFIGVGHFVTTPLPGTAPGDIYPADTTFHISVAASALHGWPPTDTWVIGEPFNYHYFVHLHMAAGSRVTGIDLPLIVSRLYLLPLDVLLVLQLGLAGRTLTGRRWAAPLTVVLVLLVREIDLSIGDITPFGGTELFHLWSSPSQLFGMTLFIPAFVVLAALLDPAISARLPSGLRGRTELWAVLVLLLIGAGGAKSAIMPALIGGLVLYLGWGRLRGSRFDPTALPALGLCLILFVVFYLLMYRGGSLGLQIDPPATIKQMPPLERLHEQWPGGLLADAAFWIAAVPAGIAMYFGAPLLGLALWRSQDRGPLAPSAMLALSLLAVGIGAFLLLSDEYLEQTYFTSFGVIAAMPLAALGLIRFLESAVPRAGIRWRALAGFGIAWVAAALLLAAAADRLWERGHYLRSDVVAYLPVSAAIAGLAIVALRAAPARRALFSTFAVVAVLLTASVDAPLDVFSNPAKDLVEGNKLYPTSPAGLRPREVRGMEWIRDNLPQDAILAVSNDRTPKTVRLGPSDGDYPAFTERRTLREEWAFTAKANELGQIDVAALRVDPFPERTMLERAVYGRADRTALREMEERYGVTHIVVSKKDGPVTPRLYSLGRVVFSNGAIDVIQLPPPTR